MRVFRWYDPLLVPKVMVPDRWLGDQEYTQRGKAGVRGHRPRSFFVFVFRKVCRVFPRGIRRAVLVATPQGRRHPGGILYLSRKSSAHFLFGRIFMSLVITRFSGLKTNGKM